MSSAVEEVSSSSKFIWKIENFSKLPEDGHGSGVFSAGSNKWQAAIFPKGDRKVYDHLSLFLRPVELAESVNTKYSFSITSQTDSKNKVTQDEKDSSTVKFKNGWWGLRKFMLLSELHDPAKGYIVNDTCIITVDVSWKMKEDAIEDSKLADMKLESDPTKVEEIKTEKQTKLKDCKSGTQPLGEHPGAGQPFGEGRHNNKLGFSDDKEFEDVGGFSILRTQAPIYMQIWLKYGHIPSTQVMPISSYDLLVMAVKDLMNSIIDMHQCRYVDFSSEMIEGWEDKIKMAETIKFNVGWLRERFESVKKGVCGMQEVKNELQEHGQPLRAAKSKMKTIEDELKKTEAQLIAAKDYLRENVSGMLSESDMEMYLEIGEDLLLEGLF
ncbi:hypothetical protein MKX03_000642 [Papaver bracteatum]|nr:hypothetical protein MKX03_000642 [Papaver bracteatum]